MTDEQINAAIADVCGWVPDCDRGICWDQNGNAIITCPKYCTDLNAMHEAEKVLTDEQCVFIRLHLRERLENHPASRYVWNATARQRAEAFLRTLGKWEEGK